MPTTFKCCVKNCDLNKTKYKSNNFFQFPKDTVLKKQWLHILNKKKFRRDDRICSYHFESRFKGKRGICKYLTEGAVPTIFAVSSAVADFQEKAQEKVIHNKDAPNIKVGTITEEPNIILEEIKEEPAISLVDSISNLYDNNLLEINHEYSDSSIHDEVTIGNNFQFSDSNNLISCNCSNRLIRLEENQKRIETKLDELLDLVRAN